MAIARVDGAGTITMMVNAEGTTDFGTGPLVTRSGYGQDLLLASFGADGTPRWSQRYGDRDYQVGSAIAANGAGRIVVAGQTEGSIDLGGGAFRESGFLAMVCPDSP